MQIKQLFTKKAAAIGITTGLILGAGGAAFAYFTTTGSGTGTGTAGTSSPVTINQTSIVYSNPAPSDNAFVPGTSATIGFSITNPSSGHQFVNKISLASWASSPAVVGCDSTANASWFTMPDVTVGLDFAPGTTAVVPTGSITFNNDPLHPQDACKNAHLVFTYSSN